MFSIAPLRYLINRIRMIMILSVELWRDFERVWSQHGTEDWVLVVAGMVHSTDWRLTVDSVL